MMMDGNDRKFTSEEMEAVKRTIYIALERSIRTHMHDMAKRYPSVYPAILGGLFAEVLHDFASHKFRTEMEVWFDDVQAAIRGEELK
jgi:hypothetical protein